MGCFGDDQDDRVMSHTIADEEMMTAAYCRDHCKGEDALFYGTQVCACVVLRARSNVSCLPVRFVSFSLVYLPDLRCGVVSCCDVRAVLCRLVLSLFGQRLPFLPLHCLAPPPVSSRTSWPSALALLCSPPPASFSPCPPCVKADDVCRFHPPTLRAGSLNSIVAVVD